MASRKNKKGIPPAGWVVIILAIILIIAFAVIILNKEEDYSYHGYPIHKTTCQGTDISCWNVEMSIRNVPYMMTFYNHPSEVENIPVAPDALRAIIAMQKVQNHTVYITVPEGSPGEIGIAGVALARVFGERYGIMNLNVRGSSADEISCSNAGPRTLVIAFQQEDIDAVLLESANCVVIGATNSSQTVRVAEAYAYHVLGVIPTFEEQ